MANQNVILASVTDKLTQATKTVVLSSLKEKNQFLNEAASRVMEDLKEENNQSQIKTVFQRLTKFENTYKDILTDAGNKVDTKKLEELLKNKSEPERMQKMFTETEEIMGLIKQMRQQVFGVNFQIDVLAVDHYYTGKSEEKLIGGNEEHMAFTYLADGFMNDVKDFVLQYSQDDKRRRIEKPLNTHLANLTKSIMNDDVSISYSHYNLFGDAVAWNYKGWILEGFILHLSKRHNEILQWLQEKSQNFQYNFTKEVLPEEGVTPTRFPKQRNDQDKYMKNNKGYNNKESIDNYYQRKKEFKIIINNSPDYFLNQLIERSLDRTPWYRAGDIVVVNKKGELVLNLQLKSTARKRLEVALSFQGLKNELKEYMETYEKLTNDKITEVDLKTWMRKQLLDQLAIPAEKI